MFVTMLALRLHNYGELIQNAVFETITSGVSIVSSITHDTLMPPSLQTKTYDLGGVATTTQFTDAVIAKAGELLQKKTH